MKTLALLQERGDTAKGQDRREDDKGSDKTYGDIADDETDNAPSGSTGSPVDVPPLETQEFKWPLKPLEDRVVRIVSRGLFHNIRI